MLSIDDRSKEEHAAVYDMSLNLAIDASKSYAQSIDTSLLYQDLLNKLKEQTGKDNEIIEDPTISANDRQHEHGRE